MLHREVCCSESLFYEIVMQRLCRQQIVRSSLVVARIVAAHDFPFVIVTQRQRGGSYPHRSTDTRTSDPEIPRQARTPNWHRHRRKHCAKVNREQRVSLLFGAESEIQSRHMLHMGLKCRFMLHKVRMYEGP